MKLAGGEETDLRAILRTLLIVAVLTVLCAAVVFAVGGGLSAYSLSQARRAAADNDPKAEALYEKILEKTPTNTQARTELLEYYRTRGNLTKTEYYLLAGIAANPGHLPFYSMLSKVYVEQDKLLDAVNLLDGVKSQIVKSSLRDGRPAEPVLSPEPGRYEEDVWLSVKVPAGTLVYYTLDGSFPSVHGRYEGAIRLSQGATSLTLVAVNQEGLVSKLKKAVYTVENRQEAVLFSDAATEQIVRHALQKNTGPVLFGELWSISYLTNLNDKGERIGGEIRSLSDLVRMRGLETLELHGLSQSLDWAALSELKNLTSLTLVDCGIGSTALSALSQIEWLSFLDLTGNKIASIEQLSGLRSLDTLILRQNSITKIDGLIPMKSLRVLDLGENAVSDLTALISLKNLRQLHLDANKLESVMLLGKTENLEYLDLSRNKLSDLGALRQHQNLRILKCAQNQIESLEALADLSRLEELDAGSNAITSILPLGRLSALKEADLSSNKLRNLPGFFHLTSLEILNLSDNIIEGIESLPTAPALKELNLRNNVVAVLAPLLEAPRLEAVYISGNTPEDIETVKREARFSLYE